MRVRMIVGLGLIGIGLAWGAGSSFGQGAQGGELRARLRERLRGGGAMQGASAGSLRDRLRQRFRGGGEPREDALDGEAPAPTQVCEADLPPAVGYGAAGDKATSVVTVELPGSRDPIEVFFPTGTKETYPVIFFSHGYGPNMSRFYRRSIDHMVSRGLIVVFGAYPMRGSMPDRYDTLWSGFERAAAAQGEKMDLTRVGFVGHSFGGGANPTMAYRGFVTKGWGTKGGFIMSLAPWYTYFMKDAQLAQIPAHVLHAVQVYDEDTMNDHRMAIDMYASMHVTTKLYLTVHSQTVGACRLSANHMLPGRRSAKALLEYGYFRPLDILVDASFGGNAAALAAIDRSPVPTFSPLTVDRDPRPIQPEAYYKFKWSGRMNPRLQ